MKDLTPINSAGQHRQQQPPLTHNSGPTMNDVTIATRRKIIEMNVGRNTPPQIAHALKLTVDAVRIVLRQERAYRRMMAHKAKPRMVSDDPQTQAKLEIPIAELALGEQLKTTLDDVGILYVSDLLAYTPDELRQIDLVGNRSMAQIFAALEQIGLRRRVPGQQPGPAQQPHQQLERLTA